MKFTFLNTKHKLGMQIWGDRDTFHELYELISDCWECVEPGMSRAVECSYIGVFSYFCYTVRHTFMGDRLVKLDGKPVMGWSDGMLDLFEEEQDRFEVGMEFSWPQVLFIMASWWECLKHKECPARVLPVMRELSENIDCLLRERSKTQYSSVEPFIKGAIYAANPYLMQTMEHINVQYLQRSRFGRVPLTYLADLMVCSAFGTWDYNNYLSTLKKHARRLGCNIEDLQEKVDETVYDIDL